MILSACGKVFLSLVMASLVEDSPPRVEPGEEGSENSSDVELPELGENVCPACEQGFGEQDQDC